MKKLSLLSLTMILSLSLFGCGKAVSEDPTVMLNKAWEKQIQKDSDYQKGSVSAEGKLSIDYDHNNVDLNGKGAVQFDMSKPEDRKVGLTLDLKGKGTVAGKSADSSITGEMRAVGKKVYALVNNLSLNTDDPQTNMMANFMTNLYKGQWVSFPVDIFDPSTIRLPVNDEKMRRQIVEMAKSNNFFEVKKDLGNRTLEVVVSGEKLKSYLTAVGKIQGTEVTPEYLASIDKTLADTKYSLQVSISKSYDISAFNLTITSKDTEKNLNLDAKVSWTSDGNTSHWKGDANLGGDIAGKLSGDFTTTWTNVTGNLEVPKDSKPFDLGNLLGGGSLGSSFEGK